MWVLWVCTCLDVWMRGSDINSVYWSWWSKKDGKKEEKETKNIGSNIIIIINKIILWQLLCPIWFYSHYDNWYDIYTSMRSEAGLCHRRQTGRVSGRPPSSPPIYLFIYLYFCEISFNFSVFGHRGFCAQTQRRALTHCLCVTSMNRYLHICWSGCKQWPAHGRESVIRMSRPRLFQLHWKPWNIGRFSRSS